MVSMAQEQVVVLVHTISNLLIVPAGGDGGDGVVVIRYAI